MDDIYDLYKPLRNALRKMGIANSLGALKWYLNYNQIVNPVPKPRDLEVHPEFWQKHLLHAQPWYIAVLVRELLIEGDPNGRFDMRQWRYYASAMNKLRDLDDGTSKRYINQSNVYHHVSKVMAHQQFVWQENRPNYQTSTRYYSIFTHQPLRDIFEDYFNLNLERYFLISGLMWGAYINVINVEYPPKVTVKPITNDDYDKFTKHYARPLSELQNQLKADAARRMDDGFLYYFDSLKRYPLIFTDIYGRDGHVCPIPTYLYWRTTDGIYYDLIEYLRNDKTKLAAFGEALGDGYSIYIGKVLNDQPYNRSVDIVDADANIPFGDPKPDWFIVDAGAIAPIECKTKRLRLDAKTDTTYTPATEDELKKLAKCVLQVYKALKFAQDQRLSFLGAPTKYFPIVATMENWYIFGDMKDKLDKFVAQLAPGEGVDLSLISKHPYAVIYSSELEDLAAVLRENTLESIMEPYCTDPQFSGWSLNTYLWNKFPLIKAGYHLFQTNPLDTALSALTGKPISKGSVKR